MILPDKHILLQHTLIAIGARLLDCLDKPFTVSELWGKVRNFPEIGTFERFTLSLDFLFILGAVKFDNGLLRRSH